MNTHGVKWLILISLYRFNRSRVAWYCKNSFQLFFIFLWRWLIWMETSLSKVLNLYPDTVFTLMWNYLSLEMLIVSFSLVFLCYFHVRNVSMLISYYIIIIVMGLVFVKYLFLIHIWYLQVTTKPIVIYPNSGETYDADLKEWVVSLFHVVLLLQFKG